MNLDHVEQIADAVLYEGYLLYPYRPSAVKNQQRWNFGVITPKAYSDAQAGTESWTMQTECVVESNSSGDLDVKVRFLQLVKRDVGRVIAACRLPIAECEHYVLTPSVPAFHVCFVASLNVNGQLIQTWQEAIEREIQLPGLALDAGQSYRQPLAFPQDEIVEPLIDENSGETVGAIVRSQQAIAGVIEVQVEDLGFPPEGLSSVSAKNSKQTPLKVTVRILNTTPFEDAARQSRDQALMLSLVSTHTILRVRNGSFVSLLDSPGAFREVVGRCTNVGTFPVLAGEEGTRGCMLSSPIILYDYPQIAPESAGSLFDGTEIDEILTLRIMTLTEEEKREMRGVDERARQILQRTEVLPQEQLLKMHGAMKGVNPKS